MSKEEKEIFLEELAEIEKEINNAIADAKFYSERAISDETYGEKYAIDAFLNLKAAREKRKCLDKAIRHCEKYVNK